MEPYDPELVEGELGAVSEGVCLAGDAKDITAATSEQVRKFRSLSQRDSELTPPKPAPTFYASFSQRD
jgi:hypothetical protein